MRKDYIASKDAALRMAIEVFDMYGNKLNSEFADEAYQACKAALSEPVTFPDGWVAVPVEVLTKIKDLPRFTFLSPAEGGVRKFLDKSGNWIEQYEVIKLIDDYIPSTPTCEKEKG